MERTKPSVKSEVAIPKKQMQVMHQVTSMRRDLSALMGIQYKGKRDVYEALGYPDEKDLTFDYYFAKYKRQDIAAAIIDRPADKTWTGTIQLLEDDTTPADSKLSKEWDVLDKAFGLKSLLKKVDKLSALGQYTILLFGFDDVKKISDFKQAASKKAKLLYLKAIPENAITITEWETKSNNPRYGKPNIYQVISTQPDDNASTEKIEVHHSRVLHVNTESLESDIFGRPNLQPVINRLLDIEKVLGGDAEMFWRGARPGYTALSQPDYAMGPTEMEALETELDKYENDMRRFITAQGIDIKALEQQVADPLTHLDAQLQAISAQTGIPKRILIGSERGELSSAQDKNEWLSLIKVRQEEHAEPIILRPFVNKCMDYNILTATVYTVLWQDVFAPSEKDKVELGKTRAESLKIYSDSLDSREMMTPKLAVKYLLGMTTEQILEINNDMGDMTRREDEEMAGIEDELEEEENQLEE